jgi:hypothetical protein
MVIVSVLGRTSQTVTGSVGPSVSQDVVEIVPFPLDVLEAVDVRFEYGCEWVECECGVLEEVDMFHNPEVEPLPVYDGKPDTEVGEYTDVGLVIGGPVPVFEGPVGGTRSVSFDWTGWPGFFPVGPFGNEDNVDDVENNTPPLPVGVVCIDDDVENTIPPLPGGASFEVLEDVENITPPLPGGASLDVLDVEITTPPLPPV